MRLLVGVFLALVFFGVSPAQDNTSDAKVFSVGAILPLTGPLSEYGVAFKHGIEMAKVANPGNFQQITFSFEDSRYEPKIAVNLFNALSRDSAVNLVIVWGNPPSEAVAAIAERDKIPTIAGAMNPKVSIGREYVIRANNQDSMFSEVLATYLKREGYSKIGMALTDNSYLTGILAGLIGALPKDVSLEIIDKYEPADTDFQSTVTKLKSSDYDAIGVFLMSGQIAKFYRQFSSQGMTVPTFGTDFFESSTEVRLSQGAMEGAVYAQLGVSPEFRKTYMKRYGNDLQLAYAGNAYDIANLLAHTFGDGTTKAAEAIIESLKKSPPRNGVSGPFRYRLTEQGGAYFEFPIYMKQIKGKDFVRLPQMSAN